MLGVEVGADRFIPPIGPPILTTPTSKVFHIYFRKKSCALPNDCLVSPPSAPVTCWGGAPNCDSLPSQLHPSVASQYTRGVREFARRRLNPIWPQAVARMKTDDDPRQFLQQLVAEIRGGSTSRSSKGSPTPPRASGTSAPPPALAGRATSCSTRSRPAPTSGRSRKRRPTTSSSPCRSTLPSRPTRCSRAPELRRMLIRLRRWAALASPKGGDSINRERAPSDH